MKAKAEDEFDPSEQRVQICLSIFHRGRAKVKPDIPVQLGDPRVRSDYSRRPSVTQHPPANPINKDRSTAVSGQGSDYSPKQQGKDLIIPYYHMDTSQKEFLVELVQRPRQWIVHDYVMTCRRSGRPKTIDTLELLLGLCKAILSSKEEPRSRITVCNIILQRIQASIPLTPALQSELNTRLFSSNPELYGGLLGGDAKDPGEPILGRGLACEAAGV